MVLGKAVGATLGSVLDQRLMGAGSEPVETGRVERFRVMGSSEGAALPRVFGRARVAGQLIWSSRFLETVDESQVGGKGGGGATVREFSYSVSIALALCEGEVLRVGRIWADGQVVSQAGLTWRLHPGSESQLPDPLIAAIEGADAAPAYRGTAYVVFENLDLTPYGNRIPQFNLEVFRRPAPGPIAVPRPPALDVRGVALVPGTGEYALATEPICFKRDKGDNVVLNVHNDLGLPDFKASLAQLDGGGAGGAVGVAGGDLVRRRPALRPLHPAAGGGAGRGRRRPDALAGLGRRARRGAGRQPPRRAAGLRRHAGGRLGAAGDRPRQGARAEGDVLSLHPDGHPGGQRARRSLERRGRPAAHPVARAHHARGGAGPGGVVRTRPRRRRDEVAAFFGQAEASDFAAAAGTVAFQGAPEWSYRRFILHYAHLCELAGGVDAFCIGSEMRSLTQIRDAADGYPAVRALCALAADVRGVLRAGTRIGYAADWSEYFGHQPADGSGDVLFHLDPLWAHPAIDFVGHRQLHAAVGLARRSRRTPMPGSGRSTISAICAPTSPEARASTGTMPTRRGGRRRTGGRLSTAPTARTGSFATRTWRAGGRGRISTGRAACGGARRPPGSRNRSRSGSPSSAARRSTRAPTSRTCFMIPKSSESHFPYHSSGARDEFIQQRYLQATFAHWADPANNPASDVYAGRMVDMENAHVWAWDARPWPDFPNRLETWVDGDNYAKGHWLNGRISLPALAEVVAEICARSGLRDADVSGLIGGVTGYAIEAAESGRQSLQPLMLAYGFDSFTVGGEVVFANRSGRVAAEIEAGRCVVVGREPVVSLTRSPAAETPGRVTLGFVRGDLDYLPGAVEALAHDEAEPVSAQSSIAIVFSEGEARSIAERWLSEGRVARDALACALPPSAMALTPGDVVALRAQAGGGLYRLDRVEELGHRALSAVRVEPAIYEAPVIDERRSRPPAVAAPTPVHVEFLDLPLLTGEEVPHAPHVAVARRPWAGPVAVYSAKEEFGYALNRRLRRPAVLGETLSALPRAEAGRWMRGTLRVRIASGSLQSRSAADVLNGANAAALRFGSQGDWEVIQFQAAELVAPREYVLGDLLRGQAGTDGIVPEVWPVGSDFVLLDGAVAQLELASAARGLERHYRVGPAGAPVRRSELFAFRRGVRRGRAAALPADAFAGAPPRRRRHRARLDAPDAGGRRQLGGRGGAARRGARALPSAGGGRRGPGAGGRVRGAAVRLFRRGSGGGRGDGRHRFRGCAGFGPLRSRTLREDRIRWLRPLSSTCR